MLSFTNTRPGHKWHDDLTSSSPSSGLSPAVYSGFQSQHLGAEIISGTNKSQWFLRVNHAIIFYIPPLIECLIRCINSFWLKNKSSNGMLLLI
ncbi:hypothetical protein G4B88_010280 [Cannabis sativa]|uniref:Uncharacterized protein n=1 Tax=Cannabis sativa TaxID=3483 RepID=A0A7J6I733_CANSA|nr:hypothetical protein G4B88_010280 [Cannabis sativa]